MCNTSHCFIRANLCIFAPEEKLKSKGHRGVRLRELAEEGVEKAA
jgi:hypothetical protein